MAAADTARLVASLELDDKFTKGVDKAIGSVGQLETRFQRIGGLAKQGFGNLTRNVTLLGAATGGILATQVAAGIASLEELERVTNATEGVIASTGGAAGVTAEQIRDMAQALEEVTTADDKVIQGGQNLLLTFTNIGEDVFPQATKAMVDMGIAMAQGDVANADFKASAIQLGKALNDPIKGITALSRVGVSFTEDQKEQIRVLTESGRVMEAQKIILGELEREFGNAGKAAGTGFGADMRRFQDAVEGAQQALARGFLPLISRVATVLNERLSDPATLKTLETVGVGLADAFEDILAASSKIPWDSIGSAMQLAGMGAKAALDFFTGLPPWVQTAVITGWGLNKLTGGALGGIVGELGKGLIKGVLGMNAGVVNINAAVVNGAGGGIPGAAPAAAAGGLTAGAVATTAAVGVVLIGGAAVSLQSIAGFAEENIALEKKGLTQAEITAQRYYNANKADQDRIFKQLHGKIPPISVFESGNAKLDKWGQLTLTGIGGLSQDERDTRRAVVEVGLKTQRAGERNEGKLSQLQNAYVSSQAAAAAAIKGAIAQTTAAAQQAAFAIRDKDLSVRNTINLSVSTKVSVTESINAQTTFKKAGNYQF